MAATLEVSRRSIGVEVRRGPYDVLLDGQRVGTVSLHETIEVPVEVGRHTVQVRSGRNSSRTQTFDASDEAVVAFRCGGKRPLPIFVASFFVPSLALSLRREYR